MFGEPLFFASRHVRAGGRRSFSEFVATFGLLAVIWGCARRPRRPCPFAVAAYITAAYWFTASTSFANPAVTLARAAQRHVRRHPAGRRARRSSSRSSPARPPPRCLPLAGAAGRRERAPTGSPRRPTRRPSPRIYNEGIADRIATFETEPRTAAQIAAAADGQGRPLSDRRRRAGRAGGGLGQRPAPIGTGPPTRAWRSTPSTWRAAARGTGAGRAALEALCRAYAERGFWKIVSRIFPENTASLAPPRAVRLPRRRRLSASRQARRRVARLRDRGAAPRRACCSSARTTRRGARWPRAFLRAMAGDHFEAGSAGTEKTSVNPLAIRVDGRAGHRPRRACLEAVRGRWPPEARAGYPHHGCAMTRTSGAPGVPGSVKRLHWSFPDPARDGRGGARLAVFRSRAAAESQERLTD